MDEKEFYKEVGLRISCLRELRGYSREGLAERADISHKFLYEIEAGKKGFTVGKLYRLAKALDVSCDYILSGQCTMAHENEELMWLTEDLNELQMIKAIKMMKTLREII